jgi:hypothetical protein
MLPQGHYQTAADIIRSRPQRHAGTIDHLEENGTHWFEHLTGDGDWAGHALVHEPPIAPGSTACG